MSGSVVRSAGRARVVAVLLATALAGAAPPLSAQAGPAGGPEDGRRVLRRLDGRIGFLITGGESFTDRPFAQVDAGVQFGRARHGGSPALGVLVGAALGFGEILASDASASLRVMAGIEAPWAVAPGGAAGPLELVPAVQVGLQKAWAEDERDGFTLRAGLGLRVPIGDGTGHITFEPVSFALLSPTGRPVLPETGGDVPLDETPRAAFELGILKFGWRF